APPVSVISFRVLPTSDPLDVDLFEAIVVIEQAVPARNDIMVFNLSFGPRGPIEDDTLSRFTYVLDTLATTHKVAFCVAVGNDGDVVGEERIQSPADLVHGLGVGAFTLDSAKPVHAPYSCQGPGRECGKVKPDLSAFGGCDNTPIHLVSTSDSEKVLWWGTSFASPLASRLNAQAIALFDRSTALLGRALLVHAANFPGKAKQAKKSDSLLGHGCLPESIDDVLLCEDDSVTVVFQGDILPGRMAKLPIPWPSNVTIPGMIDVHWTVAALAPVDPMHPGDYTSCCLEETFYPNAQKYEFRPPKGTKEKTKRLHVVDDQAEIKRLLKSKWKQSAWPLSESGNTYQDEEERRLDCKWESIVRRSTSKRAEKVESPLMTLHAIGRNGAHERFDYVVIVTLRAAKFEGDLYTEIRQEYPALAPIRLRTEAETRIQILSSLPS
ncbi:MAG: S8 family serine peptidase, partial [Lacipirellulaceae bacterium]